MLLSRLPQVLPVKANSLSNGPFMAKRIAKLSVAIAPELIGEGHRHRGPGSDGLVPHTVGIVDL
jgi:hypothetical protein